MKRKLLIFDLDETLVHARIESLPHPADFVWHGYHVYKRPFLKELLSQVCQVYDIAVWSSSSREYVDVVVENVFGTQVEVKFAWAIDRCVQRVHPQSNGYVYIKDLRKVQSQGYEVEQIIIVDDSPEKIARQPRNHLGIAPFMGKQDDVELLALTDDLLRRVGQLAVADDSEDLSEHFELTINGTPPEMLNAICQGFVCESLHIQGQPPASANVTYLKFSGTWYRLYFEFRCMFWRRYDEEALPWSTEHPWTEYVDLANAYGFAGQHLISCTEKATANGSEVAFVFENGLTVSIKDSDDRTSFEVTDFVPTST